MNYIRYAFVALACVQSLTAASVKVQVYKIDPKTFKAPWTYEIITRKEKTAPTTSKPKKFTTETITFTIDSDDAGSELVVYPGAIGENSYNLGLNGILIEDLQNKKNMALTIDANGAFEVKPIDEIKQIVQEARKK